MYSAAEFEVVRTRTKRDTKVTTLWFKLNHEEIGMSQECLGNVRSGP